MPIKAHIPVRDSGRCDSSQIALRQGSWLNRSGFDEIATAMYIPLDEAVDSTTFLAAGLESSGSNRDGSTGVRSRRMMRWGSRETSTTQG
jgi:hypothetical protein